MPRMPKKTTRGRQKIEIAKVENESNLQVTFSKRRYGLFKKASELCTLCEVEVGIIVFSPGGKVFSFGHPSVESLIDRYQGRVPPQTLNCGMQILEAHRSMAVYELNTELTHMLEVVDTERKWGGDIDRSMMETQNENWWEGPKEDMETEKLVMLKNALEELQVKVAREKVVVTENLAANTNFFVGSSSNSAAGAGPSDHLGLNNPAVNNLGFGFNGDGTANPNFFVGSSSNSAAGPGPCGHLGLKNPAVNNLGFGFNGDGTVQQAPDKGYNAGLNDVNPMSALWNAWNPNFNGGFP